MALDIKVLALSGLLALGSGCSSVKLEGNLTFFNGKNLNYSNGVRSAEKPRINYNIEESWDRDGYLLAKRKRYERKKLINGDTYSESAEKEELIDSGYGGVSRYLN